MSLALKYHVSNVRNDDKQYYEYFETVSLLLRACTS